MKRFAIFILFFLVWSCAYAQQKPEAYKFGAYDSIGAGCGEYGRVEDFLQKLVEQSDSRGMIVVYAGRGEERLGNIQAYLAELKKWIVNWRKFPADRIDFVVTEGKKVFSEDYWIVPAGADAAEFKPFEMDWANLSAKYYFSIGCPQCEPSYSFNSSQPNFEEYASILRRFPAYKGEVVANNFNDLTWARDRLTKDLKLLRNRYVIKLAKPKNAEDYGLYLYIMPTNIKEK